MLNPRQQELLDHLVEWSQDNNLSVTAESFHEIRTCECPDCIYKEDKGKEFRATALDRFFIKESSKPGAYKMYVAQDEEGKPFILCGPCNSAWFHESGEEFVSIPLNVVLTATQAAAPENKEIARAVAAQLEESTVCALSGKEMTFRDAAVINRGVLSYYSTLTDEEIEEQEESECGRALLKQKRDLATTLLPRVSTDNPAEIPPMVHKDVAERFAEKFGRNAPALVKGEVKEAKVFFTAASFFRNRFVSQRRFEERQVRNELRTGEQADGLREFAEEFGLVPNSATRPTRTPRVVPSWTGSPNKRK